MTLIATNAVFLGLAIFAVAMRIYARKHKVHYLQADDYLILAALVKSQTPNVACAFAEITPPSSSLQDW